MQRADGGGRTLRGPRRPQRGGRAVGPVVVVRRLVVLRRRRAGAGAGAASRRRRPPRPAPSRNLGAGAGMSSGRAAAPRGGPLLPRRGEVRRRARREDRRPAARRLVAPSCLDEGLEQPPERASSPNVFGERRHLCGALRRRPHPSTRRCPLLTSAALSAASAAARELLPLRHIAPRATRRRVTTVIPNAMKSACPIVITSSTRLGATVVLKCGQPRAARYRFRVYQHIACPQCNISLWDMRHCGTSTVPGSARNQAARVTSTSLVNVLCND